MEQFYLIENFYNSDDLYSLMIDILAQASINASSKYVLHKILEFCNPDVSNYSENISTQTSGEINQLLTWAENRCNGFNSQNYLYYKMKLGGELLIEAAEMGNPQAIVEALSKSEYEKQSPLEAQMLIKNVFDSKDPYAIRQLQWLNEAKDRKFWILLSCRLGAKCEPTTFNEKIAASYYCMVEQKRGEKCEASRLYLEWLSDYELENELNELNILIRNGDLSNDHIKELLN